ncbi:helix-turn-helix domain-containing protein [Halobacillus massiliensis]|uniref:helix-turn-helix domain-containing protein n=1 Tax=Halobacillus massiliensis TaxID=1926286 RepID=UPI0009E3AB54|nr:helix-turn-helix domain-containing protein [Halobacillus massiliensis]
MIGDRINKIRRAKGLSMSELASRAGFAKSYISSIERGNQKNPSIHFIEEIVKALEVSVNELLQGQEDQKLDQEWTRLVQEAVDLGLTKQQFREFMEFTSWRNTQEKEE